MRKILFLAADPTDQARLRLMEEHRRIHERIRLSKNRDGIELVERLAVRAVDFTQALHDEHPNVIHFSGHGSAAGAICLQSDSGGTAIVAPDALGGLLALFANEVQCVVLNACYSSLQSEAIGAHIDYVVGMSNTISDAAAIAYSVGFYAALGAGRSIDDAHKFGVAQIALDGLDETETPTLSVRTNFGTPAFMETPVAAAGRDFKDLVLLMTDDSGLMLTRGTELTATEKIEVHLAPMDERESAYISRLKPGTLVRIAFGSTALVASIEAISQSWSAGNEAWLIRGAADRGPYLPWLGEMAAFQYSADELATLRARRILLDERLAVPSGHQTVDTANQTMLEIFVRGFNAPLQVSQSPLPGLFSELGADPLLFTAAARLVAILWLRLSGVIETVNRLSLSLEGTQLRVSFRGSRFRQYGNVDPTVIEVGGVCTLDRGNVRLEDIPSVRDVMFDGDRRYDGGRDAVVFTGEADAKRIVCYVSAEALRGNFAAHLSAEGLVEAFDKNAAEIQRIAIALLRAGRLDDERRLFLRTADVSALRGGRL